AGADRRSREEGRGGGGGVEGAVRRSLEQSLGTKLAGSRRASVSRSCGAEDALQTGTCGTTGIEWTDSPVCASGHRELQSLDRAILHRFEPIDDVSAHHS